jgi:hypothetical protein
MKSGKPNLAESTEGSTRAYPIAEAFERLGIKTTKGFELIKSGELQSFTIGRYRYITEQELRRFVRSRIEQSVNENPADRAKRVEKAVAGRARQREQVAA